MTAFASATGFIYLAWKIDTTTRAFCEAYANSANVHMTLACTSYPGPLAAGSHTIQVVSGGGFTVTDSNDDFNYLITVYPSS
jgi:hypothetical protein